MVSNKEIEIIDNLDNSNVSDLINETDKQESAWKWNELIVIGKKVKLVIKNLVQNLQI